MSPCYNRPCVWANVDCFSWLHCLGLCFKLAQFHHLHCLGLCFKKPSQLACEIFQEHKIEKGPRENEPTMSTILVCLCVGCLCFEQMMKQPYQELESTIFCLALFGLRLRPPHMPLPDVMTSTQGRIYDDKGTPLQKNFLVPNSQAPKLKIILGWLKAQYLLPSEVITFKHGGKLHLSTSLKCY